MVRTSGDVIASSRSRFTSMPRSTSWRLYSSSPPAMSTTRRVPDTPTVRAMIWQTLLSLTGLTTACMTAVKPSGCALSAAALSSCTSHSCSTCEAPTRGHAETSGVSSGSMR